VSPPRHSAAFAAAMEDVLSVYARPPDPARPLICLDETGKLLRTHKRPPQGAVPGRPARQDSEYGRAGEANIFLACAPREGWRLVTVTARHTAVDVAFLLRDLADVHYPDAERIVLVTDQLNVHTAASLYRAFPPAEARRLAARFEWHYTPTHDSWLNMAEIELSVLTRQCLNRRVPDPQTLATECAAWAAARNAAATPITWRFTVALARVRLAHVYPEIDHGIIA
jgi:DDE superfamily endonuclease